MSTSLTLSLHSVTGLLHVLVSVDRPLVVIRYFRDGKADAVWGDLSRVLGSRHGSVGGAPERNPCPEDVTHGTGVGDSGSLRSGTGKQESDVIGSGVEQMEEGR